MPYNRYLFPTILFFFCCIFYLMFYYQSIGVYGADLTIHIDMINTDTGYSLFHKFILFLVLFFQKINSLHHNFLGPISILTLVASLYFTAIFINNYFNKRYPEANPYFTDFSTIGLMLVSMIILDPNAPTHYLGVFTPNPWHNPTYIFCKPFSILVFIAILKAYENYQHKLSYIKEVALIVIFGCLSMWAKPSFLMSFLPAVAIFFSYKFFKKEISLKFLIILLLALLPTFIPFYIINNLVYNSTQSTDAIIFTWGEVWYSFTKHISLSILLAMAFPIYVCILNFKKMSTFLSIASINFVIATMIFFFLAEDGGRKFHGNFGWGYMFAMFFMFWASYEQQFYIKTNSKLTKNIGFGLFLLHLVSGTYYLYIIALGNPYI